MPLRVTVAGPVAVEVDGTAVDAGALGRLGRLALAYLVCERRRPVPRDELAEVLWGDQLPRSWEQLLRGNASKLRAVLGAAGLDPAVGLSTAFGAYQVRLPPDAVVDVEEAEAALERALAALRAGHGEEAQRAAALTVDVAARGFLPGWSGHWVERRQAELRELHLRALEVLAQAAGARGQWAQAAAAGEEAVTIEPLRESAYQVLMASHAGAGNRGEALRAYERCRRSLVEELGISPSAATEDAYLGLLADEPARPTPDLPPLALPAALAPTPGGFLVGRRSEMERLESALSQAPTGGQAVVVGGEPGIGKTALLAHFARVAHERGARVLYGRCDEELSVAYQPFVDALGHYVAGCPHADLTAHTAHHGAELSRITPELARRLPELPSPPTTTPEADRYRLFEAVSALLTQASAGTIVVLVLDDLHWAASPTLLLLRHLLRARIASVLVLGTYRHTEVGPDHPLTATLADLRREPGVERILLEGLDMEGVSAYVERSTRHGLDTEGVAMARALHARTSGNPFFVGEFLRHLVETGAVYRRTGPWTYYEDSGFGLPEGVREVVARRLGRLSVAANRVLALASVVGSEFDLELLERLDDPGDAPDSTLDALDEAVAARVVTELGSGRYQFAHALVRDTVYSTLTASRRARLHHRVGKGLASLPGDVDRHLPALAHHFAQAATDGGGAAAADFALAAARQAITKVAWEDVLSYVGVGLRALSAGEPSHLERRFDLLLVEAEALMMFPDFKRAKDAILGAAEAARLLGSSHRMARATSLYLFMFGLIDPGGSALGEEALDRLGDSSPALRARVLASLALSAEYRDAGRSEPTTRAALALARESGDREAVYSALVARTTILADTGKARERLALEEELLAMGPPSGPVAGTRWMHSSGRGRAKARLVLGDRAGFESDVDTLERLAMARHSQGGMWMAALWRTASALLDGRFGEVEALAARARGLAANHGLDLWAVQMGKLALEQGRAGDVKSELLRVLTIEPTILTFEPSHHLLVSMLAFIHAETGDHDEALKLVEELADDDFVHVIGRPVTSTAFAYMAEVVASLADIGTATRMYERFVPYSGLAVASGAVAHCPGAVDRYLGQLAATLGRWEEAEAHYQGALDLETGLRSPPLLARTRYWYGRLLVERARPGDDERAHDLLKSALETAELLGMARLTSQASELA